MTGIIDSFDEDKLWGLIARDDIHKRVFFHIHGVRLDQLGRQRPRAMNIGSNVDFKIVQGRNGEPAGIDICPFEPFTDPVDLSTHRELSTIVHWVAVHQVGIARRESGDWLAVSHRDVITTGLETLKVGSRIWHGVAFKDGFDASTPLEQPVDPKTVVRAASIEICVPESTRASQMPAVPSSVLLSDRLRGVKLRNIRRKPAA